MTQADTQQTGTIFNIQKYSVHDGPGIRTVVFLKGCPLRCTWCSNPESQNSAPELAYNARNCVHCQACVAACSHNVLAKNDSTHLRIDRASCKGCMSTCTSACLSKALIAYGQESSVNDILRKVEQDMPFYKRSGGGMTLSGGEPLAQRSFSLALLREARLRRIRTAIETSGYVASEHLLEAAQYLNHAMYDIKHMDAAKHKQGTGVDNSLILKNLQLLVEHFPKLPILVRTPVIPDFNNTEEDIRSIAEFIRESNRNKNIQYELLPYHRLGTQKYEFLQRDFPLGEQSLDSSVFLNLQRQAENILESTI